MRRIASFVAVFAFSSATVPEVHARRSATCDRLVVGQGTPGVDVPAVTAAVNDPLSAGSVTVCLVGTFNFGVSATTPTNFVAINPAPAVTELTLTGVDDAAGGKATIVDGTQAVRFSPPSPLLRLTIKNLRFITPQGTAITIFHGNEGGLIEISGVDIDGVRTLPVVLPGLTFNLRQGINVGSTAGNVKGEIVIKENRIDSGVYDPTNPLDVNAGVCGGIIVAGTIAGVNSFTLTANVTVARNLIQNFSVSGIISNGPAPLRIIDNVIEPGPMANQVAAPLACVANGVTIVNNQGVFVKGNLVYKVPTHRIQNGTTPQCTTGLLLGNNANDNVFVGNRVEGVGSHAVFLPGNLARDNVFIGNNLNGFTPYDVAINASAATVGLGNFASGNTFVGNSGTVSGTSAVIDANTITGLTSIAGGVGHAVSDISDEVGNGP